MHRKLCIMGQGRKQGAGVGDQRLGIRGPAFDLISYGTASRGKGRGKGRGKEQEKDSQDKKMGKA